MTGVREPLALVEILAALPVTIERAQVHVRTVALRDYGGDGRPSSTVTLGGADREGQGEHVGWTREVHEQFAASVRLRSWTWRGTVAQYLVQMDLFEPPDAPPYGRAAVESALLDLALKQAGTNLAAVAGAAPGPHPMRYVIS